MITGCAHIMSDENGTLAVSPVSYEEIRDSPSMHLGKIVLLGGIIDTVSNSVEGGVIEVMQYPLTDAGYPDISQGSSGRFLVTSPTTFESMEYPKAVPLTVVGEVKAAREVKSQQDTLRLPVISLRKSHIWRIEEEKIRPFTIPGTNLVDPYYFGYGSPSPKRPMGIKTDIW